MNNSIQEIQEDEIDLKELFNTILKYKKSILKKVNQLKHEIDLF